jgi:hypothetical protein
LNPSIVGRNFNGLLRSADGGKTWVDAMPELQTPLRACSIRRALESSTRERRGTAASTDGGKTWTGPGMGFARST